MLNCSKTISG